MSTAKIGAGRRRVRLGMMPALARPQRQSDHLSSFVSVKRLMATDGLGPQPDDVVVLILDVQMGEQALAADLVAPAFERDPTLLDHEVAIGDQLGEREVLLDDQECGAGGFRRLD